MLGIMESFWSEKTFKTIEAIHWPDAASKSISKPCSWEHVFYFVLSCVVNMVGLLFVTCLGTGYCCVRLLCVIAVGSLVFSHFCLRLIMWLQFVPACCIITCPVAIFVMFSHRLLMHLQYCDMLLQQSHVCDGLDMFCCYLLQAYGLDMWFMCLLEIGGLFIFHTFRRKDQLCVWSHVESGVRCMVTWWDGFVNLGQVCHTLVTCLNTFSVTCYIRY